MRYLRWLVPVLLLSACGHDDPVDPTPPPPPPPAGVASLGAQPASVNLQSGQSQAIAVVARDSAGTVITTPTLTWRSDVPTVATVDAQGVVQALAPARRG
jgi:hypothetical protein